MIYSQTQNNSENPFGIWEFDFVSAFNDLPYCNGRQYLINKMVKQNVPFRLHFSYTLILADSDR